MGRLGLGAAVLGTGLLVALGLFAAAGCGSPASTAASPVSLSPHPATPATSPAPGATATVNPSSTPRLSPGSSPRPSLSPSPAASFSAAIAPIDAATRAAMLASGSWRPACPVAISDLRLLTLTYWGFDHRPHTGHLIVNHDVATQVVAAMRELFRARFPIERMELVDAYGASDERSMAADNTSAFNGRRVAGSAVWSQHAFGRAIDINPLLNPMVTGDTVDPASGARFAERSLHLPGMIRAGDAAVRAFEAVGWHWGGRWQSLKDYQHFSANGR